MNINLNGRFNKFKDPIIPLHVKYYCRILGIEFRDQLMVHNWMQYIILESVKCVPFLLLCWIWDKQDGNNDYNICITLQIVFLLLYLVMSWESVVIMLAIPAFLGSTFRHSSYSLNHTYYVTLGSIRKVLGFYSLIFSL